MSAKNQEVKAESSDSAAARGLARGGVGGVGPRHRPQEQGQPGQRRHGAEHPERDPAELIDQVAARGRQHGRGQRGEGGEQGILGRRVGHVAQGREVGDHDHLGHAAREVLDGDGEREHGQVVARHGLAREHEIGERLEDAGDEQRAVEPEAADHGGADQAAGDGGKEAEDFRDPGDLELAEAHLDVERVGHDPDQGVTVAIEDDEQEDHDRAAPLHEVEEGREDDPAQEIAERGPAIRRRRWARRSAVRGRPPAPG